MRTTLLPVRSSRVRLLYAGVVLFVLLAAFTARSVWRAWNERAGQARAAAVFELVQQRMPARPTEAPGAMAWLREQLAAYGQSLPPAEAATYARLWADAAAAPPQFDAVVAAMRAVASSNGNALLPGDADGPVPSVAADADGESRRAVSVIATTHGSIVVTRRRALEADVRSNGFVRRIAPALISAQGAIDTALRSTGRPVRLYAVAEDGTLVSLPWAPGGDAPEATARTEALLLAARPTLPSFAPEEFFFTFAKSDPDSVRYSGFYLDLGGRGLVSTLTVPLGHGMDDGVLALDIAHDIDWTRFASTIGRPVVAGVVAVPGTRLPTWTMLRDALDGRAAPPELRTALGRAAEAQGSPREAASPVTHAVLPGVGAVAAFQVAEATWLLTFFPSAAPSFPTGAVALLGVMLALLLTGFEVNRRKAEREADNAARALREKQNLLNTMQVPLMVVDPNTDVVVSSNQIAESIGIRRGVRFVERVSPDPRARAHYERTQVASAEARRAYGVPIRVEGEPASSTEQFAIVRSVAVTAPIDALEADERHRLGILFLVDPQSDLRLLVEDVESAAHRDERRRLAGLLSHGLDALVQVLQRSLPAVEADDSIALSRWLAEYLERRIHVTAWLLDNWDREPPPHDAVVDAAQALDTLASLDRVFRAARGSSSLRARLGWANGPLSAGSEGPALCQSLDWPHEFEMTMPIRGGLGFFLTEALSNAMRHGAAGTAPSVVVRCNRVRSELEFRIENERRADPPESRATYGGLAILEGMARLFGWREFRAEPHGSQFVVAWRAQVTRRDQPGKPD